MKKIMKVLLLGGTGAMGTHLADLLSRQGHFVYITSRQKQVSTRDCISYFQGNAKDLLFLETILSQQYDVIIDFMVYNLLEFQLRVELLLKSTKHYMFLSSARVYSDVELISEDTPRLLDVSTDESFLSTDEYSLSKARQENILLESNNRNWTIIRPYITFAEARLQLGTLEKESWLYRAIRGRTIVFSEDICEKLTTLTYALDVASELSFMVGRQDCFAQIFNLTQNECIKWSEVLAVYLDVLKENLGSNTKVIFQSLDDFLRLRPKYQVIYDRLYNRRFSNQKWARIHPSVEYTETKQALRACLISFLKNPNFLSIDWALEGILDRITGEWASPKEFNSIRSTLKYYLCRLGLKNNQE